MSGWIKIHRKMIDWEWYKDINTKTLFFHLLLTANHAPKNWKGQLIDRGQLITSLSNLSFETGLSIHQVRTALDKLKMTHEVAIKATKKYTLITIEKYSVYQINDEESGTQDDTQTGSKVATNKNIKNIRNIYKEKNNIKKESPTLEEIQNYISEKKLAVDGKQFYDYFETGNWIDSKGNKVKNWKQKLLTWDRYGINQNNIKRQTNYNNYEQRNYEDMSKFYANKGGIKNE